MGLTRGKELDLERFIKSVMDEQDIPGLSVAVMQEDRLLYSRGFGHRDSGGGLPAEAETVYGIGSVTKSFTAKAVMMLAEQGELSVGDPVRMYLPEFHFSEDDISDAITIHHLLTHTSGMPPSPALKLALKDSLGRVDIEKLQKQGIWEELRRAPSVDSIDELMSFWADYDEEPLGRPGEVFSYSNDAYALLGEITERASGRQYEEFVRESIAGEIGMKHIYFHPGELVGRDQVTQLFTHEADRVVDAGGWLHAPAMLSAGFVKTSVLDLLKYGQSYLESSLISPNEVSMMSSPFFPCERDTYYGYGFFIHPNYHCLTVVEHGGSIKGVSAHFGFIPEEDLVAAVLMNIQDAPALKVWRGAVNTVLGVPLQDRWGEEPEYECPPDFLARYEGVYRSGEGVRIKVALEDDELAAYVNGDRKKLRPSGVNTAAMMRRGEEAGLRFIVGPTGQVEAVSLGLRILRKVTSGEA